MAEAGQTVWTEAGRGGVKSDKLWGGFRVGWEENVLVVVGLAGYG